jgi:hypothetical protein
LFAVSSEDESSRFRIDLFPTETNGSDFRITQIAGPILRIRKGRTEMLGTDFFDKRPPTIRFADGSYLEGNEHIRLRGDAEPFSRAKISAWDWEGVDLKKESQGLRRNPRSIQRKVIDTLLKDQSYCLIFDDDGAGESADVVAVREVSHGERRRLDVEFYHCKFSIASTSGARVDDLYAVCGQAQKSVCWVISHEKKTDLFLHLVKREPKRRGMSDCTRFERGDRECLVQLKETSRIMQVNLKIFIVQPGLSKALASRAQLELLAVTENYLRETYQLPFGVIASE